MPNFCNSIRKKHSIRVPNLCDNVNFSINHTKNILQCYAIFVPNLAYIIFGAKLFYVKNFTYTIFGAKSYAKFGTQYSIIHLMQY